MIPGVRRGCRLIAVSESQSRDIVRARAPSCFHIPETARPDRGRCEYDGRLCAPDEESSGGKSSAYLALS